MTRRPDDRIIPANLLVALLKYLDGQPHGDVRPLVDLLSSLPVAPMPTPPPATPTKEKKPDVQRAD